MPVSSRLRADAPRALPSIGPLLVALAIVGLTLLAFSGGAAALGDPIDERAADPLANETGTTEVIVRLDPIGEPDAEGDAVVDELREHAAEERAAFEAFAGGTDHVTIEREFWLANALLVSVDADRIEAVDLLSVANVTGIHDNVVVATHGDLALDHTREQVDAQPSGSHTAGLDLIDVPDAGTDTTLAEPGRPSP